MFDQPADLVVFGTFFCMVALLWLSGPIPDAGEPETAPHRSQDIG